MKQVIGHNQAKKQLVSNLSIQSWLICGKKGIGKATLIKSFANWLFMNDSGSAVLDLHVIEDNTIGIDQIREMKNFLYLSSIQSKYKIVVIDSLEGMTNNAKNAILKVMEEPPKNSKIFIISHKPYNIQTTIKSRCFQLNLLPLTYDETKQVVFSTHALDSKIFDQLVSLFPGAPGMIVSLINSKVYESYQYFYDLLYSSSNPVIMQNCNIDLELASYIIQNLILQNIKKCSNDISILFNKWKKIDELFIAAERFHLDKKHVLTNVVNIMLDFKYLLNKSNLYIP